MLTCKLDRHVMLTCNETGLARAVLRAYFMSHHSHELALTLYI